MALAANVPTAVVELDRPRTVAFTIGAMRRFKEEAGYSVTKGVEPEDIGRLLWATLVDEDRGDISVDAVESLLHTGNIEAVGEILSSLQGAAEGNEVQAPAKAKKATGK